MFARDPEQDLRTGEALLDRAVVAVQRGAPVAVGRARQHGLGEVAGPLLWGILPSLGRPEDVEWDGRMPSIVQEPLMGRGVIGVDEGLMALVSRHGGPGQRELVIREPPLDVEMGLHPVLIALTLGADDRLMLDL